MSAIRFSLVLVNGLLVILLMLRLVALKREIDRYRPPSPLPPRGALTYTLTITRVS